VGGGAQERHGRHRGCFSVPVRAGYVFGWRRRQRRSARQARSTPCDVSHVASTSRELERFGRALPKLGNPARTSGEAQIGLGRGRGPATGGHRNTVRDRWVDSSARCPAQFSPAMTLLFVWRARHARGVVGSAPVTAFTLAHSVTLTIAVLGVSQCPPASSSR